MRISTGVAALRPAHLVAACMSLLVGACSGTGTFPGPSWNLIGGKEPGQLPTKAPVIAPALQQPVTGYKGGRDPVTGRAPPLGITPQTSLLPPAQPPSPGYVQALPSAMNSPAQKPTVRASQVEVRPGQSLANIATEQRVSIASLMAANKLRDPYIIPGQVLTIPRP